MALSASSSSRRSHIASAPTTASNASSRRDRRCSRRRGRRARSAAPRRGVRRARPRRSSRPSRTATGRPRARCTAPTRVERPDREAAARSHASHGIPRSEPVPTAPAPAIWNIDFGCRSLLRATVARTRGSGSDVGSAASRPARGPRTAARHSASQASPCSATSAHTSSIDSQPCERVRTSRVPRTRSRDRRSVGASSSSPRVACNQCAISARVRPAVTSSTRPSRTVAATMWRRCPTSVGRPRPVDRDAHRIAATPAKRNWRARPGRRGSTAHA